MELITSYIEGVFPKYVILLITQVFGETENKDNLVAILLSFLYSKPKIESNQNWSDPAAINYLKEQINILLSIYTISEKENVPLTNILSVVVDNRLLFVDTDDDNDNNLDVDEIGGAWSSHKSFHDNDSKSSNEQRASADNNWEVPNFLLSSTANEDNKNVFTSTSWDGFNEDSLVRIANLEKWLESVETECLFEGIFSDPQRITYGEASQLLENGFDGHPEALLEVVMGGAHWEVVAVKYGFYQL